LPEGLVGGVGPLRCRRGRQLTESRGKARQKSTLDWWVKQDEVQPLPKVQGAAGGCHDALETFTARGEQKHARSVGGRRRGDGR
jgi:hypothetical protein